jgi:branched-chain amino acid transport system ATP-binding protein
MTAAAALTSPQTAPLLSAQKLTRRFGGLLAVADFTLEVMPGEIVGLVGPNGAGKSTTFNLISGFLRPTAGRLFFDGEDITGHAPSSIGRRGLVRTFQHASYLPDLTAEENITIGVLQKFKDATAQNARVAEVAAMTGLTEFLSTRAGSLPHGHQRLLSMAIAIAPQPRLLGLDEPLTGLGGVEVERALDLMRCLRREHGTAILLVDHNMSAVMRLCDRIVVLHHGRLLAAGLPLEIRNNKDVIKAYLGDPE